jgi:hypothetical protein
MRGVAVLAGEWNEREVRQRRRIATCRPEVERRVRPEVERRVSAEA